MDFPFQYQYRIQKRAMPHNTRYRPPRQKGAYFILDSDTAIGSSLPLRPGIYDTQDVRVQQG